MDIILTEQQKTACSMATLDLITKAAVAGAVAYVLYSTFIKKGIFGADLGGRIGRGIGARLSKRFGLSGTSGSGDAWVKGDL
jgi:uncharacterized membrane protein YeaQ/YmgE (transglycosylase-associated protein family)